MQVPLLDLKAQLSSIRDDLKGAVDEVIESTRYIAGPKVEQIESEIADYVGVGHGVGVSSGTDALLVSLMALDVGAGDIVLTTPYSFFATAGAVARLGARPAFVDIDDDTYNMSADALESWFNSHADQAAKVKAIVPVHLYGQCADMERIVDVAAPRNIPIIEDAAQAIGARCPFRGALRRAGSLGKLGCFSFFPSKNLGGIGDGGMVVTDDEDAAEKLRVLRNHGSKPKYYNKLVGGNFRLDPIQAAVLLVKLPHLEKWHAARQKNAAYYDKNLSVAGVKKPAIAHDRSHHIYNQYVIGVPERRDELRAFLKESGVGNEVYYPVPFHEQDCFAYLGYQNGDFPVSEHAARHTLALPIYPELTAEMQDYVIGKLGEFYG